MQTSVEKKNKARQIIKILKKEHKDCWTSLDYKTPFELLISVILSAQATDAQINKLTPALFSAYPDARSMAKAEIGDLERLVRGSGFYKNKARNIQKTSRSLVDLHGGQVPKTMDELTALAGVARKTANIVLYHAYGITEGIAVDTHCMRLSYRFGLSTTRDKQNKIEQELMGLIPKKDWGMYTNWMVHHGRKYCTAKRPKCDICPLNKKCEKRGV